VTLSADGDAIRLSIEDDGIGFEVDTVAQGRGIGLMGMRERASLVGGSFALDSAPGRGTRVTVRVPWEGRR
jgi:signal transduction histidine kinase